RTDVAGARADAVQAALRAGAEMMAIEVPATTDFSPGTLAAALEALKSLRPLEKAVLVKGLFATVTADGTIRVVEAGLMRLVGEADRAVHVRRPALHEGLVAGARAAHVAGVLERRHRGEPAILVGGLGNAIGRQRHHRPVAASHPRELVDEERHHIALVLSRTQVDLAPGVVVADHHRVVPAVAGEPEVLQHDDRVACRYFRSEEHTSELQSQSNLVCRLLLEKKNRSI